MLADVNLSSNPATRRIHPCHPCLVLNLLTSYNPVTLSVLVPVLVPSPTAVVQYSVRQSSEINNAVSFNASPSAIVSIHIMTLLVVQQCVKSLSFCIPVSLVLVSSL